MQLKLMTAEGVEKGWGRDWEGGKKGWSARRRWWQWSA